MPNPIRKLAAALLCLGAAACAGGNGAPASSVPSISVPASAPAAPSAIADPRAYLAQSRACDGNPATPLQQADPITCRRGDGVNQIEDSFLTPDGGAVTTWSYAPAYGGMSADPVNNGGEHYALANSAASIDATQDGGHPGIVQHFSDWFLFDVHVPRCSQGWEYGGLHGRACRVTITYPELGPIDTVVSEHFSGVVGQGDLERFFFGLGWGRVAWMSFRQGCAPVDPSRAPPLSAYDGAPSEELGLVKCDERLLNHISAADGMLTGIEEWHP